MGNFLSLIFTCDGKITWGVTNWQKPNYARRLSNNTLQSIIYVIKTKRREARKNKKEESNREKDYEKLRSVNDIEREVQKEKPGKGKIN